MASSLKSKSRIGSTTNGSLEEGRKRIADAIKGATLEALAQSVPGEIAKLLGASTVRLFLVDTLTGELYARWTEEGRPRELRVTADLSSPAGYAAMTRTTSVAWTEGRAGDRRYVVAAPLMAGSEPRGVLEFTHAKANTALDDARLKAFTSLVEAASKRLQGVATPEPPHGEVATADALREARAEAVATGRSVEFVLMTRHGVSKAEIGKSLAEQFKKPFVESPSSLRVSGELLGRFSPGFLRTHAVLPVRIDATKVEIVMANPRNLTLLDDVARLTNTQRVEASVAIREDILEALEKLLAPPAGAGQPSGQTITFEPVADAADDNGATAGAPAQETEFDFTRLVHAGEDSTIVRLVNDMIQAAIDRGASDVHIEPSGVGGLLIRLRVDGVLQEHRVVKEQCARAVVSRLKIMSKLDIAEHRLPQDGKIRLKDRAGGKVDLRVAVVPTQNGYEDVVMRLLPETHALPVDRLGMEPETATRFRRSIEQPHGIVLCVGPTGSGKTTTLHAALGHLKGPGVKIWTAEDPVEISQEGIRQVQVHPKVGLTFAHALRAFLRCDPDVIMIGEIRDKETAQAAIEASLTGHLVMSTLHTNSAAETVTRLLEMGLDPFTFGDSLRAVLAQRLVRRVCESCRETHAASPKELEELRVSGFKPDGKRAVTLAKGKGCSACFDSGYRGRMGIHELMVVSPDVRRLIQKRSEADKIREAALAEGMLLLKQDGLRKAAAGLTDMQEVLSSCVAE